MSVPMPAFAITTSRCEIPYCDGSEEMAVEPSVSEALSSLRMMRMLSGRLGWDECVLVVGWEGSRTAAMTVVRGRER